MRAKCYNCRQSFEFTDRREGAPEHNGPKLEFYLPYAIGHIKIKIKTCKCAHLIIQGYFQRHETLTNIKMPISEHFISVMQFMYRYIE